MTRKTQIYTQILLIKDLQINKTKVKKALAGEAEKLIYNL